MKCGQILSLALFGSLAFGASLAASAQSKPVMVHYMPWFQSPYSLGAGGWGYHWTMNHSNPNSINPATGLQDVASWYYPLIGPYDSADPAVLEYHVLLMKLGGIDGVIVDWYGPDNYYDYLINDQRTLDIFAYAQKAGLKFALCYEDATIQAEITGGCKNGICVTAANAIVHAQYEMLYAHTNYFSASNYLKWNNQPVLLNFGPQYFHSSANWASIFSALDAADQPALFNEDNRLSPAGTGAFDWPPMSLSRTNAQSPTEPVLTDAALTGYLVSFDQKAAAWPAFASTAFPRFHDYYAQAGVGASYGYLDDQSGNSLRETLGRAMTNRSAIIQIATWNDFGEGTIIEPTAVGTEPTTEYGYTDLGIIQDFRRQYLDPSFPYHTNDLSLALRLYNLRKEYGSSSAIVSAELDRVFANIISGSLGAANLQLSGIESSEPVIYNLSLSGGLLQFTVGGYLSSNGIQIETTPALSSALWQTNSTLAVNTNQIIFSTLISPQDASTFVRIRNNGR